MTTRGLEKVIQFMQQSLATDGQLLARFVAVRDEAAFAALVHRHGRMVFGVCQRVLRHAQDAEDAFQGTFLILARKAGTVQKRESVASWLYHVAYRTALEAQAARLRRRERERQVDNMPHPVVVPLEPQDWRPLLDRELNRLPERYREAVVLCDLESLSRKEAAKILGLPEGTLSSRLAAARRMLARKLTRLGLSVSGGALATALSAEASAAVPRTLGISTVRAALLMAAGQLAAVSSPALLLMKGVMKTMFLKKLILVAVAGLVAIVVGASGFAYQAAEPAGQGTGSAASKPMSELEALRRENELLRLNLLVVLEKVRAQEADLAALKGKKDTGKTGDNVTLWEHLLRDQKAKAVGQEAKALAENIHAQLALSLLKAKEQKKENIDQAKEIENALKYLRDARDPEIKQQVLKALLEAVKEMHGTTPKANKKAAPQRVPGADDSKAPPK